MDFITLLVAAVEDLECILLTKSYGGRTNEHLYLMIYGKEIWGMAYEQVNRKRQSRY